MDDSHIPYVKTTMNSDSSEYVCNISCCQLVATCQSSLVSCELASAKRGVDVGWHQWLDQLDSRKKCYSLKFHLNQAFKSINMYQCTTANVAYVLQYCLCC